MAQARFTKKLRQFNLHMSSRQRGTLALSISIVCTIAIFIAWMIAQWSTHHAEEWVERTKKVLSESNVVLLSLTLLESNVYREALEGQVHDPDEFDKSSRRISKAAILVEQLVSDNSSQQKVWRQVRVRKRQQIKDLQQLLSNPQPFLSTEQTRFPISTLNQSQRSMDSLRRSVEIFQNNERAILRARRQRLDRMLRISTIMGWSLLGGSLLSAFGAMSLFWLLEAEHTERSVELRNSQQFAAAIAASVLDGVIVTNAGGQVVAFNPSALHMFGYESEAVCDRPLGDFLDKSHEFLHSDVDTHSSQDSVFKTQGIHQNTRRFPVEVSMSENIVDQQRLLIVRDMTVSYTARQRLKQYTSDLEKLNATLSATNRTLTSRNQELEQFTYLASHDLKAPLRAIMNLSSWIEADLEDTLPLDNQKQFQLLRGRVSRMESLIDGLALYASIGQAPLKTESVPVEDVIQEVLQKLKPPARITVTMTGPLPTIDGERSYLRQIFVQLIDNAIKFHEGNQGNIRITAQEFNMGWEFAVIDDGPGIEEAYHQKIFQVFQTLNPRDQLESTGIGLAIVNKILMTVGGDIQVNSAPGQGSTFYFTWPKPCLSLPIDGA